MKLITFSWLEWCMITVAPSTRLCITITNDDQNDELLISRLQHANKQILMFNVDASIIACNSIILKWMKWKYDIAFCQVEQKLFEWILHTFYHLSDQNNCSMHDTFYDRHFNGLINWYKSTFTISYLS